MKPLRPEDFTDYDRQNPQIWQTFAQIAFELIGRGFTHYSSKAIFEIIRYKTAVAAGNDIFKLNNNFTAGYARKFQQQYPAYADFFETRQAKCPVPCNPQ